MKIWITAARSFCSVHLRQEVKQSLWLHWNAIRFRNRYQSMLAIMPTIRLPCSRQNAIGSSPSRLEEFAARNTRALRPKRLRAANRVCMAMG